LENDILIFSHIIIINSIGGCIMSKTFFCALAALMFVFFVGCKDNSTKPCDHEWGDWEVTTPPTCEAPGVRTRTCGKDPTHIDIDPEEIPQLVCSGNINGYDWVRIDDLKWVTKNLNVATDNSGCYRDESSNCNTYGRLYTWNAADNACKGLGSDWRLPTNDDWDSLIKAAETAGAAYCAESEDEDCNPGAGVSLKSTKDWSTGGGIPGKDLLGFKALPGGSHSTTNEPNNDDGRQGYWWSATGDDNVASYFNMRFSGDDVDQRDNRGKNNRYSVRCVADWK
jgi:uncharacterized protein (TIGR02145 family)